MWERSQALLGELFRVLARACSEELRILENQFACRIFSLSLLIRFDSMLLN